MKYSVYFLISFALFGACTPQAPMQSHFVFMQDVTDPTIIQLNNDQIVDYINPSAFLWNGYMLDYLHITDVEYNPKQQFSIEAENELYGNNVQRKRDIQDFVSKMKGMSTQAVRAKYDHTSIWIPFLKQLEELSMDSNGDSKELILISNLMENGMWLTLYEDSTQSRLLNNPQSVFRQFEKRIPTDFQAEHITVTIINTPADAEESELFLALLEIYRRLLEKYTIHLTVRGSL